MLTTKLGESIINCIDGKYDRYQFKVWSNKGILKCPVCDGKYEYCHGEVVSPYFRHKDKDCGGYYTEPETDEHKEGKTKLYNWLKNQPGIENLQLEAWIPETKQRPDIYFEQNGKRYVIEYQCTPIASEYLKRRELYKLNNITDIWVLGEEKYNLYYDGVSVKSTTTRLKTIEKEDIVYYLDSSCGSVTIRGGDINKESKINLLDEDDKYYTLRYYERNAKRFKHLKYHSNISDEYKIFNLRDLCFKGNVEVLTEKLNECRQSEAKIIETYQMYLNNKINNKYFKTIQNIISQINREINNEQYGLHIIKKIKNDHICDVVFKGRKSFYKFIVNSDTVKFGTTNKSNFIKIDEEEFWEDWFRDGEGDDVYTFILRKLEEVIEQETVHKSFHK